MPVERTDASSTSVRHFEENSTADEPMLRAPGMRIEELDPPCSMRPGDVPWLRFIPLPTPFTPTPFTRPLLQLSRLFDALLVGLDRGLHRQSS